MYTSCIKDLHIAFGSHFTVTYTSFCIPSTPLSILVHIANILFIAVCFCFGLINRHWAIHRKSSFAGQRLYNHQEDLIMQHNKCKRFNESKHTCVASLQVHVKSGSAAVRRRRRCEKHALELNYNDSDIIDNFDSYPVTPITPPAAFLTTECRHVRQKGEKHARTHGHVCVCAR